MARPRQITIKSATAPVIYLGKRGIRYMDMFEEARAIKSTMELCRLTQSQLARQLGVSQSYVANKLRLLKFSPELEEKIKRSGISERHARSLLRLESEEDVAEVLDAVLERNLTVRECEAIVDAEVMAALPEKIGRADAIDKIDRFARAIREGCDVLRSDGIEARARTSYLGEDMYITVVVKGV